MSKHALLEPGKNFSLADISTEPPEKVDKDETLEKLEVLRTELADLQSRLYASRKGAVLLILQGMDTSGKDGTIRKVFDTVNPLGLSIHAFKQPTAEELSHDFLWRAHLRTPACGYIGIFNRSYYEAAISDFVDEVIDAKEQQRRCQHIGNFEDMLRENGTVVVKCMLHISRREQKERLIERLEDPTKYWKFSSYDLVTRSRWEPFQEAYSTVLRNTSNKRSPWHIIPADKKWYRDYAVTQIMVETLRELGPEYPPLKEKIRPEDIPD